MRIKKKTIGFFLIIAIGYMYIVTMASSFGINIAAFGIATHRAQLLLMIALIGAVCMIHGRILIYNNILRAGAFLMLYMFVCGINQNGAWTAWISCSVMWYFIILIIYNMNFSREDIVAMAPILWGVAVVLSIIYIYGMLNTHTITSVASFNSIYYVLCALPFVFLISKIKWQIIGLFVVTATVLISGKGTCLLALVVIWIIVAIKRLNLRKIAISKLIVRVGITIILIVAFVSVFQAQTNMQITEIIKDTWLELNGGGNGRSDIYQAAWKEFLKSDIWRQLVGHGYNWIDSALHIGTHNDFLMILCNYGLIGFGLYIFFWYSLIHGIVELKKIESEFLMAYEISIVVFLAVSMGSNVINTQIQFLLLCVLWGICSPHQFRNNVKKEVDFI